MRERRVRLLRVSWIRMVKEFRRWYLVGFFEGEKGVLVVVGFDIGERVGVMVMEMRVFVFVVVGC